MHMRVLPSSPTTPDITPALLCNMPNDSYHEVPTQENAATPTRATASAQGALRPEYELGSEVPNNR